MSIPTYPYCQAMTAATAWRHLCDIKRQPHLHRRAAGTGDNMRKAWRNIPKTIDSEKEEQIKQEPLERGDVPAMLLAAFLSLFLPVLLILLLLAGICYLLFAGL